MSAVRTNAAAAILGVSPNTLRSWERRFGYPMPRRTSGGHRQYDLGELEALRQAFEETHNISSAISVARERGEGPSSAARLQSAFWRFDEDRANRLLEESLSVRSTERTIDELLIPAVSALEEEQATPEFQFAWRYATGWLAAANRLAPAAHRPEGALIFDATGDGDVDGLHVQALELMLRRSGLRTLALAANIEVARLARALRALEPSAVVLVGRRASLDTLGRLVYVTRQSGASVEVFDYRGALPETGASTVCRLGSTPLAARDVLVERLSQQPVAPAAPARPVRALSGA